MEEYILSKSINCSKLFGYIQNQIYVALAVEKGTMNI